MKAKRTLAISTILLLGTGLAGCSSSVPPDQVGLYYMKGSQDGFKFGHCMDPGASDSYEWNNEIVYLPANVRTWVISDDDPNADSKTPIVVSGKPLPGQTSGTQVNVWSQTNLALNSTCDGEKGGPLREFWEALGKRYKANEDAGWKNMLRATIESSLKTAIMRTAGEYTADELVNNPNVRADLQAKIAITFGAELKRVTGKDYFCGPAFVRGKPDCPPVEVIITGIEYSDAGIQAARNEKAKAVEAAAAKVAEAQGQVDAAKKLDELYRNEAWMKLEQAKIQLQIAQACAASPKCTMVMGVDGKVQITQ